MSNPEADFGQEYAVEFTTGGVMDRLTWTVAAEFETLRSSYISKTEMNTITTTTAKEILKVLEFHSGLAFSYSSYYASDPRGYVRHGPSTMAGLMVT